LDCPPDKYHCCTATYIGENITKWLVQGSLSMECFVYFMTAEDDLVVPTTESNSLDNIGRTTFSLTVEDLMNNYGYVEGMDLVAFNFDWRKNPSNVVEDVYRKWKQKLEKLRFVNGHPSFIVAHSYGCVIASEFFEKVKETAGEQWLADHIKGFLPIAGPFLGSFVPSFVMHSQNEHQVSESLDIGARFSEEVYRFFSEEGFDDSWSAVQKMVSSFPSTVAMMPQQLNIFPDEVQAFQFAHERNQQYHQFTSNIVKWIEAGQNIPSWYPSTHCHFGYDVPTISNFTIHNSTITEVQTLRYGDGQINMYSAIVPCIYGQLTAINSTKQFTVHELLDLKESLYFDPLQSSTFYLYMIGRWNPNYHRILGDRPEIRHHVLYPIQEDEVDRSSHRITLFKNKLRTKLQLSNGDNYGILEDIYSEINPTEKIKSQVDVKRNTTEHVLSISDVEVDIV